VVVETVGTAPLVCTPQSKRPFLGIFPCFWRTSLLRGNSPEEGGNGKFLGRERDREATSLFMFLILILILIFLPFFFFLFKWIFMD